MHPALGLLGTLDRIEAEINRQPRPGDKHAAKQGEVEQRAITLQGGPHNHTITALATALLQHAEAWAAASGYTRVVLSTLASMAPAVALYPARGYAPSGPAGGAPMDYHGCAIRVVTFERRL